MRSIQILSAIAGIFLFMLVGTIAGQADENNPVLVEMFLSQSCSSCVPAAKLVSDYADRPDLVVLSWHVDYWDQLNVPGHGRWKDPYSDPAYTERQRRYNRDRFGSTRVYTPQAVVAGRVETVGSRRATLEGQIAEQKMPVPIGIERFDGGLKLSASQPGEAMLVWFYPATQTSIRGGENNGVDWLERNVVARTEKIGPLTPDTPRSYKVSPEMFEEFACAVIFTGADDDGVSARYCPAR